MREQKVLIAGGGIAGLILAHALARLPVSVVLAEPHPPKPFDPNALDGRTVAIAAKHVVWLRDLGVWDRVEDQAAPITAMRIVDDSVPGKAPSPPHLFTASEAGLEAFFHNVPAALLRWALWESLPSKITRIGAEYDLAEYDLCVAADGRHSPLRERAGIAVKAHETGQAALTFAIRHSKPHDNVSSEIHRKDGPLTFVPLKDRNCSAIVFVDQEELQKQRLNDKASLVKLLNECAQDIVHTEEILTEPVLFPLPFMEAESLHKNTVLLMAEAAHVLHPLGAQGLNLSIQDGKTLYQLIEKSLQNGLLVNDRLHVLQAYEQARRPDHFLRQMGIRASLALLRRGDKTGRVRRGILTFLDRTPALRRSILKSGTI